MSAPAARSASRTPRGASLPVLAQSYAAELPELSVPHAADPAPAPRLVALDEALARDLGIEAADLRSRAGLALLTGRVDAAGKPLPDGEAVPARPFTTAQAYAGHQFGQPNPLLGDGRAVLLGEMVDESGRRRDMHLKGSGPTPFARAGDGKAPLAPMLRELVVSEAMAALGIPTTRSLAVVATGETVTRRRPSPESGAILVRVAASHLRVGTFQYAAWHLERDVLERLTAYAIDRHWPEAADAANPPLELLRCVSRAQAELVAQWMLAGFVHGVMNTDNMTVSGEGIDYGPCAFLDEHRAGAVFSSIDAQGRYAYGNQPGIALWNLSRLGEALLPLIDADPEVAVGAATAVLEEFEGTYVRAWTRGMAMKLGIGLGRGSDESATARVRTLGEDVLDLLERQRVDHTGFFRALTDDGPGARGLFSDGSEFDAWHARLLAAREEVGAAVDAVTATNPVYVPRNHHLDRALTSAEQGDLAPLERLREALRAPFTRRAGFEDLEGPGAEPDERFVTFCGT